MAHLRDLWFFGFLEERSGTQTLRVWFSRGDESALPALESAQRSDRLLDVRPAGLAFLGIDLGMPRALVHCECKETVATQFGRFLRGIFGVEIVTANATSLISTVEEHHQF